MVYTDKSYYSFHHPPPPPHAHASCKTKPFACSSPQILNGGGVVFVANISF